MVNKMFMGRVFLPPAPSNELYINIGWSMRDQQIWPEWMPIFESMISKKDYDEMIGEMKTLMDDKSIHPALKYAARTPCFCVCLCPIVIPMALDITKSMKTIGDMYNGADVKLVRATRPTANTEDMQGWDQYGKPCENAFGENACMLSCWPPLGYNIVLKAPQEAPQGVDIRSTWPKLGSRSVIVASGPIPLVNHVEFGKTLVEELQQLATLKESGALSEQEFAGVKAALLSANSDPPLVIAAPITMEMPR